MDGAVEVGADLGGQIEALQVVAVKSISRKPPALLISRSTSAGRRTLLANSAHCGRVRDVDRVAFDAGIIRLEPPQLLRIPPAGDDCAAARTQSRDERLADSRRAAAHHGDRRGGCLGFLNAWFLRLMCRRAGRAIATRKTRPRTRLAKRSGRQERPDRPDALSIGGAEWCAATDQRSEERRNRALGRSACLLEDALRLRLVAGRFVFLNLFGVRDLGVVRARPLDPEPGDVEGREEDKRQNRRDR